MNTENIANRISLPQKYDDPRSWCIDGQLPPPDVWAVISLFYRRPLQSLAARHGFVVVPSGGSCYRPVSWERSKGRSGNSLHTFRSGTWGACDLVRADGGDIAFVLDILVEEGPWRRICWYPGVSDPKAPGGWRGRFIHVDFGDGDGKLSARRQLFVCDGPHKPWLFCSFLPEVPGLVLQK